MPLFGVALVGLQIANAAGSPPTSPAQVGAATLILYAILVGLVAWLERKREPAAMPEHEVALAADA